MYFIPEDLIKLGVALLVGALIGAERERHRKAVGLRTLILISMGSAIFTILSIRIGSKFGWEVTRIASNIVVGIGFLGAGVILEERGRVTGLTTAATTWLVAALGMAAGAGEYVLAGIATVITILVLYPLAKIEEFLEINTEERVYEITTGISWEKFKELKSIFKDHEMVIYRNKQEKREKDMVCTFEVMGPTKKHDKLVQKLLSDKDIKELWF
ncbi:MAG: MgtC/SapB family protein [Chloroflexi bacterium]|nr:MgtC/SapB family protein [Chloroflexota bacterium]